MLMELLGNSGFCALLGAFIGGAMSLCASLSAARSQSKTQIAKLEAARKEEFRKSQIDELMAIENLINEWAVSMVRVFHSRLVESGKDGHSAHESSEATCASDDMRSAAAELAIRRERLMDDSLRAELKELTSGLCLSDSEEEILAYLDVKTKAINSVTEHLGREHRKIVSMYLDEM